MALVHVTTHDADARANLLQQYKDKPRFFVFISSITAEIQAVEDAMWAVYVSRQLQSTPPPTGDLLAKLGAIVGQSNMGLSDAVFLNLIMARIAADNTNGQKNDIIKVFQALYYSSAVAVPISVQTLPGTAVRIEPFGALPTGLTAAVIANQFLPPMTVGAGIAVYFVWSPAARSSTLVLGSVYAPGYTAGPPPANTGVLASQILGTAYFAGYTIGPPPTNTGGAVLASVTVS